MNITFFSVAHLSFGGGYEQQIIRLANSLAERGHNIRVVTLSKKATHWLAIFLSFLYFHPRFNFPELQKNRRSFTLNKNINYITCKSITYIRKSFLNTDVIYAKNEILDSLLLRFAIDNTTPPRIAGMHTVLAYTVADSIHSKLHNIFYKSFFYKFILTIYNGIHCISRDQEQFLKKLINKTPIFTIPNFIETSKSERKVKKDIFQVLYVGRLTKEKGIEHMITIIKEISKLAVFKQLQFVVCGNGAYEKEIEQLMKTYTNVTYKGFVEQTELFSVYRESDVLLFPSKGETFGLACVEAQQAGVPVIAFDIPALRNVVLHNKTGFLVANNNLSQMKKKLLELVAYKFLNKNKFLKMSKNAREFVESTFTKNRIIPQLEMMFATVSKGDYEK